MTLAAVGFLFVVFMCVALTFYCVDMTLKVLEATRRSHDDCHLHTKEVAEGVATVIGKHILLAAAEKFDSIEEQQNIKVLAREQYTPDGPSVPALWLRQLADKMDMTL
jgi:hypothetical protein